MRGVTTMLTRLARRSRRPRTTQSFINGTSVAGAGTYDNIDPATGQSLGPVGRSGADEVDQAVAAAAAAAAAQPGWNRTLPETRARLLTRLADLIERDAEDLARVESEDTGKPLSQARVDATVCARYFRFYGHAIDSYYALSIPPAPDQLVYTRKEPFGVVASIVAWNYPVQLLSRAVAAAIATGNATIIKPADETPRTAVTIARLAIEAGIPPGVFNVVTGIGAEAGAALAAHPGVSHLSFVGSTQIGSAIAHAAADRIVPTVLELGAVGAGRLPRCRSRRGRDLPRQGDPPERGPDLLRGLPAARAPLGARRGYREGRRHLRQGVHRTRHLRPRPRAAHLPEAAGQGAAPRERRSWRGRGRWRYAGR